MAESGDSDEFEHEHADLDDDEHEERWEADGRQWSVFCPVCKEREMIPSQGIRLSLQDNGFSEERYWFHCQSKGKLTFRKASTEEIVTLRPYIPAFEPGMDPRGSHWAKSACLPKGIERLPDAALDGKPMTGDFVIDAWLILGDDDTNIMQLLWEDTHGSLALGSTGETDSD